MTNVNKKDNEFQDLKYLLTSTMRTKLIISVYEKSKNLEDLRNELNKPSATILHGLKELENLNYVKKLNKYYSLTSNGYLLAVNLLKLIENWYAINKNKLFWDSHSLDKIPEDSIKDLCKLKNAECVISSNNDLTKALTKYIELISGVEELHIILPIFSEIHISTLINLIEEEKLKRLEIITTQKIIDSIKENPIYSKAIENNKNIKIKVIDNEVNFYLTCSERFTTLNLFFKDGHYDDSQLLIDYSDDGLQWGQNIFNNFNV